MRAIWKLTLFMILLVAFYVAFGIIINWQLNYIASLVETLHEHSLTVTRGVLSASRDTIAISRNAKDMILVQEREHLKSRLTEIEFYEKNIMRNMTLVLERIQGPEGRELTLQAIDLLQKQQSLRERLTDAIFAGQTKKADDLARLEGIPLMEKIEAIMTKIANYAQANSMKYRVESINALRHSKIILYSAGLIIVLLSLLFSVLIGGWLIRAFARSKNAVLKAAQIPIDLTMTLKPNILGGINVAINTLFANLNSQMSMLTVDATRLEAELAKSEFFKAQLPERIKQIAAKLKSLIKKIQSLPDDHRQGERGLRILQELFSQIKGDMLLIGQMAGSQSLRISELERAQSMSKDEAKTLLIALENHERLIKDSVDRSGRSILSASDLLNSLQAQIAELLLLTNEQMEIVHAIQELEAPVKDFEQHLAHLKEIETHLNEALGSLKLAK